MTKLTKMIQSGEKLKSTNNNLSTSRTAERHARGQKSSPTTKLILVQKSGGFKIAKKKIRVRN